MESSFLVLKAIIKPQYVDQIPKAVKVCNSVNSPPPPQTM